MVVPKRERWEKGGVRGNTKSTSFKGTTWGGKKIFTLRNDESAELEPELSPDAAQEVVGSTETVEPL